MSVWLIIEQIGEGSRFRMVAQIYDNRLGEARAEAAFDQHLTDALDVSHSFIKSDLRAADKKLRLAFWRWAANAIFVHVVNLASKPVWVNTNFPDSTWFSRYDITFQLRHGFRAKARFSRYDITFQPFLNAENAKDAEEKDFLPANNANEHE